MSASHRLWLCAFHYPAFGNGGWAHVRKSADEVAGAAGGARQTSRLRMLLMGLVDGLKGVPAGELQLIVAAPDVALMAPLFGHPPPADADPAVYAPAIAALKPFQARLLKVSSPAGTPVAFAQAWADLAGDKAKAQGAFRAAIPRPNLAKVPGL